MQLFKGVFVTLIISCCLLSIGCSQKSGANAQSVAFESLDHKVLNIDEYQKYLHIEGKNNLDVATLAGGCFWCTEAAFERIEGVVDVISGYSGGEEKYPSYKAVCDRQTGHAEAINVYYDSTKISYKQLLEILFVAHDPTQLNRQGNDVGPQYRSAIFYHNDQQKTIAEDLIAQLDQSAKFSKPIVTEVTPYSNFWVAEGYHQNFYELNPYQGYVNAVSRPKVEKVLKTFPDLIKSRYKK